MEVGDLGLWCFRNLSFDSEHFRPSTCNIFPTFPCSHRLIHPWSGERVLETADSESCGCGKSRSQTNNGRCRRDEVGAVTARTSKQMNNELRIHPLVFSLRFGIFSILESRIQPGSDASLGEGTGRCRWETARAAKGRTPGFVYVFQLPCRPSTSLRSGTTSSKDVEGACHWHNCTWVVLAWATDEMQCASSSFLRQFTSQRITAGRASATRMTNDDFDAEQSHNDTWSGHVHRAADKGLLESKALWA